VGWFVLRSEAADRSECFLLYSLYFSIVVCGGLCRCVGSGALVCGMIRLCVAVGPGWLFVRISFKWLERGTALPFFVWDGAPFF